MLSATLIKKKTTRKLLKIWFSTTRIFLLILSEVQILVFVIDWWQFCFYFRSIPSWPISKREQQEILDQQNMLWPHIPWKKGPWSKQDSRNSRAQAMARLWKNTLQLQVLVVGHKADITTESNQQMLWCMLCAVCLCACSCLCVGALADVSICIWRPVVFYYTFPFYTLR